MYLMILLSAAQDVRQSHGVLARFHGIMGDLLADVRRTPPSRNSIAAHLLGIEDPRTGEQKLSCAWQAGSCACSNTGHPLRCAHVDLHGHDTCTHRVPAGRQAPRSGNGDSVMLLGTGWLL